MCPLCKDYKDEVRHISLCSVTRGLAREINLVSPELEYDPKNIFLARNMTEEELLVSSYFCFAVYETCNIGRNGHSSAFSPAELLRHMTAAGYSQPRAAKKLRAEYKPSEEIIKLMEDHEDAVPIPKKRTRR